MNEIDIFEFLKSYKDKKIIYLPNPGNRGDAIIAHGAFTIFDKIGLNYELCSKPTNYEYKNELLFFGGGGNLIGLYKDCLRFLKRNIHNNKIVLLPHTIENQDNLIKRLDNNVKVICRELKSYQYVHSLIQHKENVFISKDMAFYINNIDEYKKRKGIGTINCFRVDAEKTDILIPQNNKDIVNEFVLNYNRPLFPFKEEIISNSRSVFNYLSQYEIINTNRLHVAISGALLGKKVRFWPNSYWKNKEMYEYCLKGYKNIIWMDQRIGCTRDFMKYLVRSKHDFQNKSVD